MEKYENDSRQNVAEAIKAAVLFQAVPSKRREVLGMSGVSPSGYDELRATVVSYIRAGQRFDSAGALVGSRDRGDPMDVSYVGGHKGHKGSKGGGKSFGSKGSSKGSTGSWRSDSQGTTLRTVGRILRTLVASEAHLPMARGKESTKERVQGKAEVRE